MGRKPLFDKAHVLDAINRWVAEHGVAPTIRELAAALGVGSVRTAVRYLRLLEDEGDIQRWPGARGLKPLKRPEHGSQTIAIPIVGQAPAGPLMTAEENLEGWIRLPSTFLRLNSGRFFLLRVRGDSMNRARVQRDSIEDGDLLLVRQQTSAEPGEIVVALIDGEATIKRLDKTRGYWVLRPESKNTAHHPIVLEPGFRIQGVVLRVLKKGSEILQVVEE